MRNVCLHNGHSGCCRAVSIHPMSGIQSPFLDLLGSPSRRHVRIRSPRRYRHCPRRFRGAQGIACTAARVELGQVERDRYWKYRMMRVWIGRWSLAVSGVASKAVTLVE